MKPSHFAPLKRTILASMILVPIVPFILVLMIGYYYFATSLENSTIASMQRIVEDHRHMIESFLEERKRNLEFVCKSFSFQDLGQPEILQKVFNNLQNQSPAFFDLGIFDADGLHVAYCGPFKLTGKVYKEWDWFKEIMKYGYYISDVFLGYRQIPHFIMAVAREENNKRWVIRATIDSNVFNDLVKKVHIGLTGEAYILNAEGVLQTDRRSGGNLMDAISDPINYPANPGSIKTFISKDVRATHYLYATTWLKDKKWILVVRREKADAFNALRSAAYLILIISLAGIGVIGAVAVFLTNRIVNQMEKMDAEKDRLNQQLIGTSRLAELGEMAAGFAHEINNPLQIIKSEQSLIELLFSELKESGRLEASEQTTEIADSMDQINLQISRCAEITKSILKFARQSEPVPQDIDLQSFIPEVTGMIEKKATVHGIALEQNVSQETAPVHGDPSQLQQVLLNLYNNAMDAIIERHGVSGGKLSVNCRNGQNGRVIIEVRDNGCGIRPENIKKIFSPFFTTKPVGKGTGLGLSVCYGIIDSMGGTSEVRSEEGVGTIFSVHLPAAVHS